jgi:hypothetical protein
MACAFILWNIGGVMVSSVMMFVWFHKKSVISFKDRYDTISSCFLTNQAQYARTINYTDKNKQLHEIRKVKS